MSNAKRDQNNVPTKLALLNTDGETVTLIAANPSTHTLSVDNDTNGSDNGPTDVRALRDENFVPVMMALSDADGETLVPLYVDADGKLLIDET